MREVAKERDWVRALSLRIAWFLSVSLLTYASGATAQSTLTFNTYPDSSPTMIGDFITSATYAPVGVQLSSTGDIDAQIADGTPYGLTGRVLRIVPSDGGEGENITGICVSYTSVVNTATLRVVSTTPDLYTFYVNQQNPYAQVIQADQALGPTPQTVTSTTVGRIGFFCLFSWGSVADLIIEGLGAPAPPDACPSDPAKTAPGICGCGTPDSSPNTDDPDSDSVPSCNDVCPNDGTKTTSAGQCGCGSPDTDADGDTYAICNDSCDNDATKTAPGVCGCGVPDSVSNIADSDADAIANCNDSCIGNNASGDTDADGVCNDRDDLPWVQTTPFSGAQNGCSNGGVAITAFIDRDATQTFTAGDTSSGTSYVCHGAAGTPGAQGPAGATGASGSDGLSLAFSTSSLPAGVAPCAAGGGVQIRVGVDDNGDGDLDAPGEVDSTENLCNGASTLVATVPLALGNPTCPAGGIRFYSGVDANGNGSLEPGEAGGPQTVCSGLNNIT
ncbi:MAG TPA: hypothetical protein VI299_30135, partial [Polyangiales bacterium]